MIQQFELKNFKCHEGNNYFSLPGVTIVSGTNNSGKSSLLQSIYLLTQAKSRKYPILGLNDELKLGGFSDILNKNQPNTELIELGFSFDKSILRNGFLELIINIGYKNPSDFVNLSLPYSESNPILNFLEITFRLEEEDYKTINFEIIDEKNNNILYKVSGDEDNGLCRFEGLVPEPIIYKDSNGENRDICSRNMDHIRNYLKLINNDNIKYIKAFRMDEYMDGNQSVRSNLGLSGEYTAQVLHKYYDSVVDLIIPGETEPVKFSRVFDYWIHQLLGNNYRIRSNSIDKDKYKITLHEIKSGYEYNLNQVGFGISQILPIIILLLTSKKNDIILIENPEVHLHPKLQSLFVELCIFALENKRKLVVETHSEHIINRLRYKIKLNPTLIEKINILFFEKNDESTYYSDIEITKEGRLAHWPENFFDQTYNDLLGLIDE